MKELLKKKTTKIGIAVIILAVAIGIISINARSAQKQREYDGHVEAAEKYLTELDYEQAIAEYALALEIEPNNEEVLNALEQTYLDYAQSLADAGNYEKAVSVLEEGYAQTGRESLREKIDDVRNQQAQREAEEAEARRLEEEAAKTIEFPFELTDFNVMGYDLFDYHGVELCEAIGCSYTRGDDNMIADGTMLSESDSEHLYAHSAFSNTHEAVSISSGREGGSWTVDIVWNLRSSRSANMSTNYYGEFKSSYNILDYTNAPIVAGVSSYEDWNRIMQVDSIKALELVEEECHDFDDFYTLVWIFQTKWGKGTYTAFISKETGEEEHANLRIDSNPSYIDIAYEDSFVYEITAVKRSDGMIQNCRVSYRYSG